MELKIKMIIPKKIRIGKYYYQVKRCKIVDWSNSNVVGNIHYGDKKIRLKKFDIDKRINEINFFHEVAHGIIKELEFNYPKISIFRNNEKFIQEFGLVMRNFFLDLIKRQKK